MDFEQNKRSSSGYDGPKGNLSPNQYERKTDKHPHWKGSLQLTKEILQDCARQMKEGEKYATIQLAGWDRPGNGNGNWISVTGSKKWRKGE
jgi:hypothetical protein